MALNRSYTLHLTTLTPLHIGTNRRLRNGIDFVEHGGAIWVANQSRLMSAVLDELLAGNPDLSALARILAGKTLAGLQRENLLPPEYFDLEQGLFRYRLPGAASKAQHEGELFEFIKDVDGNPYLPGSSLKGALRSALLRGRARKENQIPINYTRPKYNKKLKRDIYDGKHAAEFIEDIAFVPKAAARRYPPRSALPYPNPPNYDLWRALKLADSSPLPIDGLGLANADVYPLAVKGDPNKKTFLPLDFEVLPKGTALTVDLKIEDWLFCQPELGFTQQDLEQFTTRLPGILNRRADVRLREEQKFFRFLAGQTQIEYPFDHQATLQVYGDLQKEHQALEPNEMLLQIGRGSGWRGITLGSILHRNLLPDQYQEMVRNFDLGKGLWIDHQGKITAPRTRLVATCGAQVRAPLGWVKIRMEAG
jgi:CRISPR-associated protein Csm5